MNTNDLATPKTYKTAVATDRFFIGELSQARISAMYVGPVTPAPTIDTKA